jgi:hypothetical protein
MSFVFFFALIVFTNSYGIDDWKSEFEYLCGRTEEAMDMEARELNDMVERCQRLLPLIEASNNPQKKIYIKRLESCMNLYRFVLESKLKR